MLMPIARANLGVAVVDDDICSIGGNTINGVDLISQVFLSGDEVIGAVEKYDHITGNWTSRSLMPTARDSFAVAVYQNKIYCIGERSSIPLNGQPAFTSVNQVYDPATDTWQTKAPIPTVE